MNDDAIALKGGKGANAWNETGNGGNENITVTRCHFGFCHACLTLGSEALRSRDIVLKDSTVSGALKILNLKMRTDTHQEHENVFVKNLRGKAGIVFSINSWSQYHELKDGEKPSPSSVKNVVLRKIHVISDTECDLESRDPGTEVSGVSLNGKRIF